MLLNLDQNFAIRILLETDSQVPRARLEAAVNSEFPHLTSPGPRMLSLCRWNSCSRWRTRSFYLGIQISELVMCKFRNFFVNEMLLMPLIRTDLSNSTSIPHIDTNWFLECAYAARKPYRGPKESLLSPTERKLKRYRMSFQGLCEVRWWDSGAPCYWTLQSPTRVNANLVSG